MPSGSEDARAPRDAGNRLRFLPISVALGLFVGDLLTLALTGALSLRRLALSATVAGAAWYVTGMWVSRRDG